MKSRSSTMPSRPICATCRFWAGSRQINAFNIEWMDGSGRCGNIDSPTYKQSKDGRQACGAWQGVR